MNKEKLKKFNQKSSTATLEFIVRVKRKDGQDYGPSSLRGLFSSFNRHLKEHKYSASIMAKTLCLIKRENAWKLAVNN